MAGKGEDACPTVDETATIQPPKLEDAGLEDCALPLVSIMEAFARAAVISNCHMTVDEEKNEEDEANADTREKYATVVVEGSSGRNLAEDEESDPEIDVN